MENNKQKQHKNELNDTQKYILHVLENVLNISEKMNLKCYMQGGTMLGAIRHGGFIPWDDDVDLGMMRDDYEYFLKHVEEYLPENLELRTYWDESEHHYYFARIIDNRHLIKRMGSAEVRYENVWVDIFPLDGMPNKKIKLEIHKIKLSVARLFYNFSCIKKVNAKRPGRPLLEKIIINIAVKLPVDKFFNTKKCLDKIDCLLKKYPVKKSELVINFMGQTSFKFTEMLNKNIYGCDSYYLFENVKMLGPEKYDQYLTSLYGNYMIPPKDSDKNAHVSELVEMEEK